MDVHSVLIEVRNVLVFLRDAFSYNKSLNGFELSERGFYGLSSIIDNVIENIEKLIDD